MLQFDFGFKVRRSIKLGHVEQLLREQKILTPVPSRTTLIEWIESGTWEGGQLDSGGWYVYEDSFIGWVKLHFREPVAA